MKQFGVFLFDASLALLILMLALNAAGLLATFGLIYFCLYAIGMLARVFGWKTAVLKADGTVLNVVGYHPEDKPDGEKE